MASPCFHHVALAIVPQTWKGYWASKKIATRFRPLHPMNQKGKWTCDGLLLSLGLEKVLKADIRAKTRSTMTAMTPTLRRTLRSILASSVMGSFAWPVSPAVQVMTSQSILILKYTQWTTVLNTKRHPTPGAGKRTTTPRSIPCSWGHMGMSAFRLAIVGKCCGFFVPGEGFD